MSQEEAKGIALCIFSGDTPSGQSRPARTSHKASVTWINILQNSRIIAKEYSRPIRSKRHRSMRTCTLLLKYPPRLLRLPTAKQIERLLHCFQFLECYIRACYCLRYSSMHGLGLDFYRNQALPRRVQPATKTILANRGSASGIPLNYPSSSM